MFKKINCKFTNGSATALTIDIDKIVAIASSPDKPGQHYIYIDDNIFLINNKQRKEIENCLSLEED